MRKKLNRFFCSHEIQLHHPTTRFLQNGTNKIVLACKYQHNRIEHALNSEPCHLTTYILYTYRNFQFQFLAFNKFPDRFRTIQSDEITESLLYVAYSVSQSGKEIQLSYILYIHFFFRRLTLLDTISLSMQRNDSAYGKMMDCFRPPKANMSFLC